MKATMENEVSVVPTPKAILEAAAALAQVCDGAHEQDGMGYNGCDSPVAKSILRSKNPTVRQIRALWNILRKYRKQLEARGILYELLVPPPLPAVVPGAPAAPFVPQAVIVKLQWADTQYGRRIVLGTSVYSADVVTRVKQCPKRWFDKDGKNSVGIKNAWLIPDEVGHLDNLVGLIRQITPAIEVEVAADLKATMDAAREMNRKAYAGSRAESSDLEVPTKLPPRPFQRAGIQWTIDRSGRVLIGDEPGLGKTLQALGYLSLRKESLPALVICPAGLRGNWVMEIKKFTDFSSQILTAKSSLKQLRKAGFVANEQPEPGYDLTILNYDILSTETASTWIKMLHKSDSAYAVEHLVKAGMPAIEKILKAMAKKPGIEISNRLERVRIEIEKLGSGARGMKEKRYFISFVNGIPLDEFVASCGFQTLIADEIHYVKDPKSQRGMAGKALSDRMENVIGLSGTPILNRPMEVWNIVNCINPKIFPSQFEFGKRYANGHQTRFGWDFSGSSNLEELDQKLRSTVMIRRMKEQVLKDLPKKIRITVPLMLEGSEYEDQAAEPLRKLALLRKEREEWKQVLATLTDEERKKFISDHAEKATSAQKITGFMIDEIEQVKQAAVRAKFNSCVKFILDLQEAKGKVIVFMSHHEFIDRMVEDLQKAKLSVATIDGRVPMGQRVAIKDAFQDGDTQLLVCGIRAASEGLTLTASHTVAFGELDWNYSRHQQCEDRVHRIGQTVQPTMYYLIGIGTIEEPIAQMIDKKLEVVNAALGEGERTINEDGILDSIVDDMLPAVLSEGSKL